MPRSFANEGGESPSRRKGQPYCWIGEQESTKTNDRSEDQEEKAVPMVKLEPKAGQAIKTFFAEKEFQRPLRIQLQSSGCCDPSLCLSVDNIQKPDLIQEVEGLTFIMSPEIHELVGEVTIAFTDEIGRKGFVLTSSKPVSEWEGWGVSSINL